MWFASGGGFFVVSSAEEAGNVVCGCVGYVYFALHVRVEYVAMCSVWGTGYDRDGQERRGFKC
jgi:hypothetical protein